MNKLDTVLLVSDSQKHRRRMRAVLVESYHILEAANASQALLLWNQNISCIAAVIADITSNHSIDPLFSHIPERMPLILLCREDSPQILNQGFAFGAADVIPLDYDSDAMLRRIDTITHLYNHKLYLERTVEEQAQQRSCAIPCPHMIFCQIIITTKVAVCTAPRRGIESLAPAPGQE